MTRIAFLLALLASLAAAAQPTSITYSHDARGRVTSRTIDDGASIVATTYTYDADGNRLTETTNGQTTSFDWDAKGRLIAVTPPVGNTIRYQYDPRDRRISEDDGVTIRRFHWNQDHLTSETNAIGNELRRYRVAIMSSAQGRGWAIAGTAAMALILGYTDAGAAPIHRSYLHDALATPIAVVNSDGAIANRTIYDAWGNLTSEQNLDPSLTIHPNRIGFTGYQIDRATSAAAGTGGAINDARYYAKARYYGAALGSFLSVDPWAGNPSNPISLGKYIYAFANPTVYVDPDGRVGWFTDWVGRHNETESLLAQEARNGGPLAAIGIGVLRAVNFIGSTPARALNTVSNFTARVMPGDAFMGVRDDAGVEIANAVDPSVEALSHPIDTGRAMYRSSVDTASFAMSGEPGALSDLTMGGALALAPAPKLFGLPARLADVPNHGQSAPNLETAAHIVGEASDGGMPVLQMVHAPGHAPVLDPATTPIHRIRDARRLSGTNRGAIFVREPEQAGKAADFEAGANNAFGEVASRRRAAPALRFDNPNQRGNNFVRFDGYEDGGLTMIDRKTQLTTKPKQLKDLERVSAAALQNPSYRVIFEFPTQEAATAAIRILNAQEITNITVRVAKQ